jgi:hypothetical protein
MRANRRHAWVNKQTIQLCTQSRWNLDLLTPHVTDLQPRRRFHGNRVGAIAARRNQRGPSIRVVVPNGRITKHDTQYACEQAPVRFPCVSMRTNTIKIWCTWPRGSYRKLSLHTTTNSALSPVMSHSQISPTDHFPFFHELGVQPPCPPFLKHISFRCIDAIVILFVTFFFSSHPQSSSFSFRPCRLLQLHSQ